MTSLTEHLLEEMDSDRKKHLNAALKQIEKQYGKGSWHDPEVKKAREKKNRAAQEKGRKLQAKRDAAHQHRLKTDPKYKKEHDDRIEATRKHWEAYGKARAAGDPSIVSKDGWTGD
jgi:hypothetical protein